MAPIRYKVSDKTFVPFCLSAHIGTRNNEKYAMFNPIKADNTESGQLDISLNRKKSPSKIMIKTSAIIVFRAL